MPRTKSRAADTKQRLAAVYYGSQVISSVCDPDCSHHIYREELHEFGRHIPGVDPAMFAAAIYESFQVQHPAVCSLVRALVNLRPGAEVLAAYERVAEELPQTAA